MPTWLLAVLIAYLIACLHFFTFMAEEKKKKPGEDNILSKKGLIVHKALNQKQLQ